LAWFAFNLGWTTGSGGRSFGRVTGISGYERQELGSFNFRTKNQNFAVHFLAEFFQH